MRQMNRVPIETYRKQLKIWIDGWVESLLPSYVQNEWTHSYVHQYTYIYIYVYIEREDDRWIDRLPSQYSQDRQIDRLIGTAPQDQCHNIQGCIQTDCPQKMSPTSRQIGGIKIIIRPPPRQTHINPLDRSLPQYSHSRQVDMQKY